MAWLLVAVIFIFLFNGWFLYINFKKVSLQEFWVRHTYEVMDQLNQILSETRSAESSVRGYILLHEEAFLSTFKARSTSAQAHLDGAKTLTQDNLVQQVYFQELNQLLQKRLGNLQQLLNEAQRSGKVSPKLLHDLSGDTIGMDSLRSRVDEMKSIEIDLLRERSESSENSKIIFLLALFFTSALSLAMVLFGFFQVRKNHLRALEDAESKAKESREQELLASLSGLVAGDLTVERAAEGISAFLSERMKIVSSRIYLSEYGRLRLASQGGATAETMPESVAGLVLDAFRRHDIWAVDDVPSSYWHIHSGLGSSVPRHLIFLPLEFQGKNIGVVEMASFEKLPPETFELLKNMRESMGVGLNAAQSRQHLQILLEKTQMQTEELQTQQEELRANNEELEQQARALESQQQSLNIKNQEIENSRRELELKANDLLRSSQYKSDFLAKMSHELRTPLNGLLILSTLLVENKEKNLNDQQIQFAKSIHSSGNDLLNLISDILDLSKIEARKLQLRPENFRLHDLFTQIYKSFEPQTAAKGLQLKLEMSDELANQVAFTDRQRVEQIIRNFLSNALKFTESGSITIKVKKTSANDFLRIVVADTGIGIPEDKKGLIFEAFEQADGSVSRKYGGTGLGLTISNELASLLGGDIALKSEVGQGSEFTLNIPSHLKVTNPELVEHRPSAMREPRSNMEAPVLPKASAGSNVSLDAKARAEKILRMVPLGRRTILIVEDDDAFRSSVAEVTQTAGFFPLEASDGEIALAVLQVHTPDAVLLDIKLPGISGLGLLEMMKQMPQFRHIPVHMISAMQYQHNALRMGALGYLAKPVTMEKIRSAISRIESLLSQQVRKVLLIEDDINQSEAIRALISGADVQVDSSRTGKEALAKVQEGVYDCVILDLTLPDVSGFDLLSELNLLNISLPPIVIYTGKDLTIAEENYLRRYSESIILKGARSPERLFDEVNLFLHRVESMLPREKREMLIQLRSQEKLFEGKTVLIVDDDMRNVFALTSALESKNITIRIARNGLEALEAVEKYADIDAVLMDIMMPKMDGYEAMRRIRSHPEARVKNLPVIALTAKAMKEDHEKCMEAGASDYLPKPINLNNLLSVLKVWLSREDLIL